MAALLLGLIDTALQQTVRFPTGEFNFGRDKTRFKIPRGQGPDKEKLGREWKYQGNPIVGHDKKPCPGQGFYMGTRQTLAKLSRKTAMYIWWITCLFLAHVRTICGQFHGDYMPVRLKNAKFYLSSKLYICNNPRLNLAERGNNYGIYILIHRRPDKKNMHKYNFLHKVYEC